MPARGTPALLRYTFVATVSLPSLTIALLMPATRACERSQRLSLGAARLPALLRAAPEIEGYL